MTTRLGAAELGILLEQFLEDLDTENTREAYCIDLCQLVDFLLGIGVFSWGDVTPDSLKKYVASLQNHGYLGATQARKVASLHSFFDFLAQKGIISQNPAEEIEIPQVDRHIRHPLTREEVTRLFEQAARADGAAGLRDRAILELLYATGLLASELVSLNVRDIDFQESYIRCWGKGAKKRIVSLDSGALAALKHYLAVSRPVLVGAHKEEPALFVSHRGERLTRQWVWAILKTYGEKAGINQRLTPYTLRHSFATHMLQNGASMRHVQELLGHSKIETTRVYKLVK